MNTDWTYDVQKYRIITIFVCVFHFFDCIRMEIRIGIRSLVPIRNLSRIWWVNKMVTHVQRLVCVINLVSLLYYFM